MKTAMLQLRNSRTVKTALTAAFVCIVMMGTTANAAFAWGFSLGTGI
jgi:hypothetical protein